MDFSIVKSLLILDHQVLKGSLLSSQRSHRNLVKDLDKTPSTVTGLMEPEGELILLPDFVCPQIGFCK